MPPRILLTLMLSLSQIGAVAQQLTSGPQTQPLAQAKQQVLSAGKTQVSVPATGSWVDTGLTLNPGDRVSITAGGSLQVAQGMQAGPEGMARGWRDVIQSLPLNSAGRGALIARIGTDPAVVPFLIGANKDFNATRPGHLFLRVNLGPNESIDGSYNAAIQVTPAAAAQSLKAAELKFDTSFLAQIPRRVTDAAGGVGDMVNFMLIGSQQQVLDAFANGGWVRVDKTKGEAAIHAILSTLQKQSYLEMPMSELYLFGRTQDYGMARAEPVAVVQTRHHLRIWKAPLQIDGHDVWVGAATHDLGFEKDQRNGSVTHHIDPNVDDERDFVKASLTEGGGVLASTYALPSDPIKDARTATGGTFHSDGRLIVMRLQGSGEKMEAQ